MVSDQIPVEHRLYYKTTVYEFSGIGSLCLKKVQGQPRIKNELFLVPREGLFRSGLKALAGQCREASTPAACIEIRLWINRGLQFPGLPNP